MSPRRSGPDVTGRPNERGAHRRHVAALGLFELAADRSARGRRDTGKASEPLRARALFPVFFGERTTGKTSRGFFLAIDSIARGQRALIRSGCPPRGLAQGGVFFFLRIARL